MSTNCIHCGTNTRTGGDLLCDACRQRRELQVKQIAACRKCDGTGCYPDTGPDGKASGYDCPACKLPEGTEGE